MHFGYKKIKRVVSMAMWKEEDTKEVLEVDRGVVTAKDMVKEGVYRTHVLIGDNLVMHQGFVPNLMCFANISIVLSMSPKSFPTF
jgi:hypothetical protein